MTLILHSFRSLSSHVRIGGHSSPRHALRGYRLPLCQGISAGILAMLLPLFTTRLTFQVYCKAKEQVCQQTNHATHADGHSSVYNSVTVAVQLPIDTPR